MHDHFWSEFRIQSRAADFDAPSNLSRRGDSVAEWLSPNLLFSQTCGYPFATKLAGRVQLLGTPHYDVAGCSGPQYSSAIVVRKDAGFADLDDLKGAALAINGFDSLSGFRCLTPLIGNQKDWFGSIVQSGAHRASALMVSNGEADCAAIDAVCWQMFREYEPHATANLRVLKWTPLLPALPFITSRQWSDDDLNKLRMLLSEFVVSSAGKLQFGPVSISGLSLLSESNYAPLAGL